MTVRGAVEQSVGKHDVDMNDDNASLRGQVAMLYALRDWFMGGRPLLQSGLFVQRGCSYCYPVALGGL